MAKFKVKLIATTEVSASCEIEVEAANEDEARDKAIETYERLEQKQEEALAKFHAGTGKHPGYLTSWDVDSSDIDVDSADIEVDDIEEVE